MGADRIIRPSRISQITGYSKATIYRKELAGQFPRRVVLGPGASGWRESEVNAWIAGLKHGVARQPRRRNPVPERGAA